MSKSKLSHFSSLVEVRFGVFVRLQLMEKNTTVRVRELEKLFLGIYNNESDAIFRFCLIRTSDREVALDMTQDTFMRFWRSLVLEIIEPFSSPSLVTWL